MTDKFFIQWIPLHTKVLKSSISNETFLIDPQGTDDPQA